MGLRNSFKNIRRGLKNNQLADDDEPPPKRRRVYYGDNEENVTQEEHDRAVKKLKGLFIVIEIVCNYTYTYFRCLQWPRKEKRQSIQQSEEMDGHH